MDREVQDTYRLQLNAFDGGTPPLVGTLDVLIQVEDVNDNRPVFENDTYEVFVVENVSPDASIIRVQAIDLDTRDHSRIVYGFNTRTQQDYGTMFNIDPHSGDITTNSALNFALGPTFELGLTASDSDTNLPSVATLLVHVVDINDHAPLITVNSPADNGHLVVEEEGELGMYTTAVSHHNSTN